ncbi:MAG: hypothetical protein QNJ90_16710 [Planctomycetota bacterium]|nr:hypothetical protein [Planctomycetota bacterium]
MAKRDRLLILVHEKDADDPKAWYRIWSLCERWRASGVEVVLQAGVPSAPTDDIVFNHVDRTVLEPAYLEWLARCPRTINGRVVDIRKSTFSRHLVRPGDGYEGPVIVKTDLNHGGLPEKRRLEPPPKCRWYGRRRSRRHDLGTIQYMNPSAYPVFESVAEVPAAVFENPALVVEQLLVEREGDQIALYNYYFLGATGHCVRRLGPGPPFKGPMATSMEEVPVPGSLLAERERRGFDYGKWDFVMCAGEPCVLDMNRTPGLADWWGADDLGRRITDALEPGLEPWRRR